MSDGKSFSITRGVRQGDVLSPLLFNAALEHAFRKWKTRLVDHGWRVSSHGPRLTNIRYADDILLMAKTREELVSMLELLIDELAKVGLNLNTSKTKLLTTDSTIFRPNTSAVAQVGNSFLHILGPHESHKYLGRKLSFGSNTRCDTEIANRIAAAWAQFHKRRKTFANKSVSLKLRLKLFVSTVSPCALYGLGALTFTNRQLRTLEHAQRRMLRTIVGWVRIEDEPWHETMSRMKTRVDAALRLHPVPAWGDEVLKRKWLWAGKVGQMSADRWPRILYEWDPREFEQTPGNRHPTRQRGRPRTRWEDDINGFSRSLGFTDWQHCLSRRAGSWHSMCDDFVNYVNE